MRRRALVTGLVLALLLAVAVLAEARTVHNFGCAQCHRSGVSYWDLGGNNMCLSCHNINSPQTIPLGVGYNATPIPLFAADDASDALGSNTNPDPVGAGSETSHMWAGPDLKPEAGAQAPTIYVSQFNGYYGISTGKLTCSRCHNPHGTNTIDTKILKVNNDSDQMCTDCHLPWNVSYNNALLSHPMVANYYNSVAGNPDKFYNSVTNVNYGDVRLVAGGVSCTSCHAPHFADSNSTTINGKEETNPVYNTTGLMEGDGHLLRTDGPRPSTETSSKYTYNAAVLRSRLCQACHTYKVHGKTDGAGDLFLGCLDCHGGHSYNGGDTFYYVLKKSAFNPLPAYNSTVIFRGYVGTGGDAGIRFIYNSITSIDPAKKWKVWNDQSDGTANGYCESCHGDAKDIPGSPNHNSGGVCTDCHFHNDTDWNYSFQNNSDAASCGDCHGYPPYLNERGDRPSGGGSGVDGGYGWMSATHNYNTVGKAGGFFKDESQTPHNTHAAGNTAQGADTDYRFASSQGACDKCHNNLSANHQETTDDTSFQDVNFDGFSNNGGLTPSYNKISGVCSNTYCHSNGGRRVDDVTRIYNTVDTPSWGLGKGKIIGQTSPTHECQFCHGNDSTSMNGVNSASHLKHVAKYSCNVCHSSTAASSTVVYNSARWIPEGGTHVNGLPTVLFNTTYSLGSAILNSANFTSADGTCSVYCHSDGKGSTVTTPDWDEGATGACGACHDTTGQNLGGSHERHVYNSVGPTLVCSECHDTGGINDGTHDEHVSGTVDVLWSNCDTCHGIETVSPKAWDVSPTWGNPSSEDCRTCHIGTLSTVEGSTAQDKTLATASGHNYNSASPYTESGNPSAKKGCTDCHEADAPGHFDGISNDDVRLKLGVAGFPAVYNSVTAKNSWCLNCHGASGIVSHQGKNCIACHDPHGSTNIFMIHASQAGQNAKDADYAGGVNYNSVYSGNVVFLYNSTGPDSYDENDDTSPNGGNNTGDNTDDLCATCHSDAQGTTHNNRVWNASATHSDGNTHEGENCFDCHSSHTDTTPFAGSADACNGCHGSPPLTSDRMPDGGNPGAHAVHAFASTYNVLSVDHDATDCAACHPGADTYTYDKVGTHRDGSLTLYNTSLIVPQGPGNYTCTIACHASAVGEGDWTDTSLGGNSGNGLACTACHDNPPLTGKHDTHVNGLSLACTACHDDAGDPNVFVDTQGSGVGVYQHNDPADTSTEYNSVRTQGKDFVTADDAEVSDAAYNSAVSTWNDTDNSCSNTDCHDPSSVGTAADWNSGSSTGNCGFCHGEDAATMTTGSHDEHLAAAGTYGRNAACAECHVNNGVDTTHRDGALGFAVGVTYNSTNSNCTASPCHQDGAGSDVDSPAWDTPSATVCATCHSDKPTSGAHGTHLYNTLSYGPHPGESTDCGECHDANHDNVSMNGYASHFNGTVQFNSATLFGATTACNPCHGGATPAATAKGNWSTPTRVSCASCHGGGDAPAVIGGTSAPNTAPAFAGAGHGKTGVARVCEDCHAENSAHISGGLGDNRLDLSPNTSRNFETAGQENDYCNDCHGTTMSVHFYNSATPGGSSDDAVYCYVCHNPHGEAGGQDTMIRDSIAGKPVTGFYNSAVRSNYYDVTAGAPYGVCQVCHDAVEVTHFNRTDAADTAHKDPQVCTDCHKHDDTTAFAASGCDGCHGDGAGESWPQALPVAGYYTREGAHPRHVAAISAELYNTANLAELVALQDSENKQKAICAYCHPGTAGESTHDTNEPTHLDQADVFDGSNGYFKHINGSADDGTFDYGTLTCSNVECHNNAETPGWYDYSATPTAAPVSYGAVADSSTSLEVVEGSTFTLEATVDDTHGGGHNVAEAEYFVDIVGAGGTAPAAQKKTLAGTLVSEVASFTVDTSGWTPGNHTLYVHGRDDTDTSWGTISSVRVKVLKDDGITATFTDLAPATAFQGKQIAMARMQLSVGNVDDGKAVIDAIKVDLSGGSASDVAEVNIYDDNGEVPGSFDSHDALLGSGAINTSIGVLPATVTNAVARNLFIAFTLSPSANSSNSVAARITDGTYITAQTPDLATLSTFTSSSTGIDSAGSSSTNTYYLTGGGICNQTRLSGTGYTVPLMAAGNSCGAGSENDFNWSYSGSRTLLTGYVDYPSGVPYDTKVTFTAAGGDSSFNFKSKSAAGVGYVDLVEVDPTTHEVVQLLSQVQKVLPSGAVTYITEAELAGLTGVVRQGYTFGVRVVQEHPTSSTAQSQWAGTEGDAAVSMWLRVTEAPAASSPPIATGVTANGASEVIIHPGDPVDLSALVSDTDNNTIVAAEYFRGGVGISGTGTPMNGAWASSSETVTYTIPGAETQNWLIGTYKIYVHGEDGSDGWGPASYCTVKVEDNNTLFIDGSDLAPPTARPGDLKPMLKLETYTGSGDTTISEFTVELIGDADPNDVAMAYIYYDDGDGLFQNYKDLVIGTAQVSGLSTVVQVTPTWVDGLPETFYVALLIADGATDNHTIGAKVTGITLNNSDIIGDLSSAISLTTQIRWAIGCGDCHAVPYGSGKHLIHSDGNSDFGECEYCHNNLGGGYQSAPTGTHNDGLLTINLANTGWVDPDGSGPSIDGTCDNAACHNYTLSQPWVSGTATCTDCHGYPPTAAQATTVVDHSVTAAGADYSTWLTPDANGNTREDRFLWGHKDCWDCHGRIDPASPHVAVTGAATHKSYSNARHGDTMVFMNGPDGVPATGAGYNSATGGCAVACHGSDNAYRMQLSGKGTNFGNMGGGCIQCHNATDKAGMVWYTKGHTDDTGFTCKTCHDSHGAGNVEIPNQPSIGIDFSMNGEAGIALGSPLVPGATEAEICWNCHDLQPTGRVVSEWGLPYTDSNGAAPNYNSGSLWETDLATPTSRWVWETAPDTWEGRWWKSAKFAYKTERIQSTHAADFAAGAAGVDPLDNIRCSYCHDLHDTNVAPGDNSTGAPYLRGTWKSNPYKEDGAPRADIAFTENGNFGNVPRGGTQASELGGYQIDQNNGNPTTGGLPAHQNAVAAEWSLANSAGLCTMCHSTDVDNMNYFGNSDLAWVATNGHANSSIGGSGTASGMAANIFSNADRNPNGAALYTGDGSAKDQPMMVYINASIAYTGNSKDYRGYGFRSQDSGGYQIPPLVTAAQPYAFRNYNWGATIGGGTTDNQYHKFSCSKCHNPHASRLPRLMITNCLDTKHNSWDDLYTALPNDSTVSLDNRGVTFSNATSAQNCHRLRDPNLTNGKGSGWNTITPWTDSDGYGTGNPPTQDFSTP